MSAKAGWYPDPGGGQGLFRYWDGKAWSAATSPNPSAPPPSPGLGTAPPAGQVPAYGGDAPGGISSYGQQPGYPYGQQSGQQPLASGPAAYARYQQVQQKRSPIGWWIAGAALVVAIVVVGILAVRAVTGAGAVPAVPGGGQPSSQVCPPDSDETASPAEQTDDNRVHGGPVSYPRLGAPWGAPQTDERVPFGRDVQSQLVVVEPAYQPGSVWVASILVGELQAGDGFFTPEQGSQIVVKCILGKFYGDNPVESDVKVNKATTIDGHEGWLVESHLTFDIAGLKTKGETLIVAIVATQDRSGLYYASIPDTVPDLLPVARTTLDNLRVDG